MAAHNDLGAAGEARAADYLLAQGFTVLERNWRGDHGEIDIIASHDGVLAIVEVKTRTTLDYGDPLAAVDRHKLDRLWRLGWQWVRAHPAHARGLTVRVDVIGIVAGAELVHLEDVR